MIWYIIIGLALIGLGFLLDFWSRRGETFEGPDECFDCNESCEEKNRPDNCPLYKLLSLIVLFFVVQGCAGYTYNGIRGEDLRHPNVQIVGGVITSFAVHTLGHIAFLEATGYDYHLDGFNEYVDEPMSNTDGQIFAMAGFAAQLGLGYAMKGFDIKNDFTKGYNTATMAHIISYPALRNVLPGSGDDLKFADDHGGDGNLYWGIASMLSVGLNIEGEK